MVFFIYDESFIYQKYDSDSSWNNLFLLVGVLLLYHKVSEVPTRSTQSNTEKLFGLLNVISYKKQEKTLSLKPDVAG